MVPLLLLGGAIAGLAVASACLPDLAVIADTDAGFDDSGAPVPCGNGVIEADAGGITETCDPGADAEVKGCKSCQIVCEGLVDPKTQHCYFAAGTDAKYLDALNRCKNKGGGAHVVTLGSSDEVRVSAHRSADGLARAARGMLAQVDSRIIESLEMIAVPTLVLVGADDTPFLGASDYMSAKIPGAKRVTIPGAGHAANIHQPALFNEAVEEFLASLG